MSFVRASSRPRAPRAALGGEPRERRPGRPRGHLLRMVSALGVYSFALADTAPVLRRRDTAVYCHAVATSPAYRSRAGSSGSLQAGSRLVARVRPRPDPATPFWACEVPFSPSLEASDAPPSTVEGYVHAGVYRCSSPKNLVAMGPAIVWTGRAFGTALRRLH